MINNMNEHMPESSQCLLRTLQLAAEYITGLLFPPRCAACRTLLLNDESILCAACRETLWELRENDSCPVCARPESGGFLCPTCAAAPPPFEKVSAAFVYGAAIADVIHRLKYQDAPWVAAALAELCADAASAPLGQSDLIVPIPLHPTRLQERGFNQSALLAGALARKVRRCSGKTAPFALRRVRPTRAQVGQNAAGRRANMRNAFLADERIVRGRRILIVDDVMTTGATVREAALAAIRAGASEVRVFCAARALEK